MNIAARIFSQDSGVRRRVVLEAREQREALLVHRIEPARQHRLEELFLAAEVIVDRGEVDAGRGRDLAQRRRLEAVLHEQRLGGVEDPLLRRRALRRVEGNDSSSHGSPFCHSERNEESAFQSSRSFDSLRSLWMTQLFPIAARLRLLLPDSCVS